MNQDVSLDDFMIGLLTSVAGRGIKVISIRGDTFYRAVASAYRRLEGAADRLGLDLRFVVMTDPIHGDSPAVREAISNVVLRDLATLDSPERQDLRFKLNRAEAAELLADVPGGAEAYRLATDDFLACYP